MITTIFLKNLFKASLSICSVVVGVNANTPSTRAPAPCELTRPWENEITQNELDIFAQLVMAEAGNQDLTGKRLVADVVINRVNSDEFPDSIESVIRQKKQFSCIEDGGYDRCYGQITKECYDAIIIEYTSQKLDGDVLYFSSTEYAVNGVNPWKHQNHWFSY